MKSFTAAIVQNCAIDNLCRELHYDNIFSSVSQLFYLLDKRIFAAGTIKKKKPLKCPIESERMFKKWKRGVMNTHLSADEKIAIVNWLDNNVVEMASYFIAEKQTDVVLKWIKKGGRHIEVEEPKIIALYNPYMEVINKHDFQHFSIELIFGAESGPFTFIELFFNWCHKFLVGM